MKYRLYKLTCLTNLHMGNGDVNYNVVDLSVERDPVTGEPTMNASGVKGALRDYCKANHSDTIDVDDVFGSEPKAGQATTKGTHEFFCGDLLARPVRVSAGTDSYALATTPDLLKLLKRKAAAFNINLQLPEAIPDPKDEVVFVPDKNRCAGIEGKGTTHLDDFANPIGENWAVMPAKMLNDIDLPIFAHNVLKDGISQNLWYEEMVPHESVFTMIVGSPENGTALADALNGAVVQFGAGATTGNGFVKIEEVGA